MHVGVNQLSETVDLLLARLRLAARADRRTQGVARLLGWLTVVLMIAPVVAFVFFDEVTAVGTLTKLGAMGAMLVLLVIVAIRWRRLRRLDLDDRKLQTVQKVLGILRADIPKDAPVLLTLDLRGYQTGGKVMRTKGRVTVYQHAWLDLSVPLADGNTLSLAVTDRVKRKVKRKSSREQWRSDVELGLRLDKRYGDASDAARRLRRIAVPKPLGLVAVEEGRQTDGRARRLSAAFSTAMSFGSAQLIGGDALLAAVRWAYAGLAPERRSA